MTTVLLVEDQADLADIITQESAAAGYHVLHATHQLDLATLDWMLPKLDGLAVLTVCVRPPPILVLCALYLFYILMLHVLVLFNGLYPVFGIFQTGFQGFVLLDLSVLFLACLVWGTGGRCAAKPNPPKFDSRACGLYNGVRL